MDIYEFEIPAHTTRRECAVYIVVAKSEFSKKKLLYVGKVGDNREGCNPIISRIGNHFSHNPIHSQLRNKIPKTVDFSYKIHYCTFGLYNKLTHSEDIQKVNEVERRLNTIVQSKLINRMEEFELLNPFKGSWINKKEKEKRQKLLTQNEIEVLERLSANALSD